VQRKSHDLYEAHQSPLALESFQRIGSLYRIESEIRGRPPDERLKIRKEQSLAIFESLRKWWSDSLSTLSRKSELTTAIHYALGGWTQLLRFCSNGSLEIDNNAANAARGICRIMPNPRLCRAELITPAKARWFPDFPDTFFRHNQSVFRKASRGRAGRPHERPYCARCDQLPRGP
jgi:hypothetical protein